MSRDHCRLNGFTNKFNKHIDIDIERRDAEKESREIKLENNNKKYVTNSRHAQLHWVIKTLPYNYTQSRRKKSKSSRSSDSKKEVMNTFSVQI